MKILLPFALLLSSSVLAKDPKDSIEISIKDLSFTMPKNGKGIAGDLNFSRVNMFRDGMVLALDNQKEIFNSKIFIRPTFIGFKSDYTSIGFKISKDAFAEVNKTTLINSKITMNETYFNFSGERFHLNTKNSKLDLKGFRYYCDAHPELDSTSGEGIIAGCLKNSTFNSLNKNEDANADYIYQRSGDKESSIKVNTALKQLELKEDKILATLNSVVLNDGDFKLSTSSFTIDCNKDSSMIAFDSSKLTSDCVNSAEIKGPIITINNPEKKSNIKVDVTSFQFLESEMVSKLKSSSVIFDSFHISSTEADISCGKPEDILEASGEDIADSCLNDLYIKAPTVNISDKEEGSKFNLDIEKLIIKDGNLSFKSNNTEIVDESGNTNLLGLNIDCEIEEGINISNIDTFLEQCLKSGKVGIDKLDSTEIKKVRASRRSYRYRTSRVYSGKDSHKYKEIVSKETSAKDLDIVLYEDQASSEVKLYLEAKVNIVFGKFFTIKIWADVEHIKGDTELIIKVRKTKLPLGIKWVGLLMHYVKKFTRSVENINVDGKNIHILL